MRLCDNSCPAFFTHDGVCDDGGEGSRWNNCGQLGTDCADCGVRRAISSTPASPQHDAGRHDRLFWGGLCLFVAWRGFGKTKAHAAKSGGLASKDEAAEDAGDERLTTGFRRRRGGSAGCGAARADHRLHPDIDTVLFTSHRDGSNAAGCVSELVADLGDVEAVLVPGAPAAAAQRRAVHVQDPAGDQVPRLQGVHPRVDELAQVRLLSPEDRPRCRHLN